MKRLNQPQLALHASAIFPEPPAQVARAGFQTLLQLAATCLVDHFVAKLRLEVLHLARSHRSEFHLARKVPGVQPCLERPSGIHASRMNAFPLFDCGQIEQDAESWWFSGCRSAREFPRSWMASRFKLLTASMSPQRLVRPRMDMGSTRHILKGFSVL